MSLFKEIVKLQGGEHGTIPPEMMPPVEPEPPAPPTTPIPPVTPQPEVKPDTEIKIPEVPVVTPEVKPDDTKKEEVKTEEVSKLDTKPEVKPEEKKETETELTPRQKELQEGLKNKSMKAANAVFSEMRKAQDEVTKLSKELQAEKDSRTAMEKKLVELEAKPQTPANDKKIEELEKKIADSEKASKETAEKLTEREGKIAAREEKVEQREIVHRVYSSQTYKVNVLDPAIAIDETLAQIAKVEGGDSVKELYNDLKAAFSKGTPEERYLATMAAGELLKPITQARLASLYDKNEQVIRNHEAILAKRESLKQTLEEEEKAVKDSNRSAKTKEFVSVAEKVKEEMVTKFKNILTDPANKTEMEEAEAYLKEFVGRALTPTEAAEATTRNAMHFVLFRGVAKALHATQQRLSKIEEEKKEMADKLKVYLDADKKTKEDAEKAEEEKKKAALDKQRAQPEFHAGSPFSHGERSGVLGTIMAPVVNGK